ncbi:hypothetical protein [Bradyrhizobium brasilense]|uniref:Uncharacterized protein n=1 Tax=Bradyrhizobium brasilense TaxID=1419277 RepID=A0A1G7LPV6_9BRAD|nr:hypothetical protein [Bradyrhizobium brasilense]MCC8970128.1 hypothetical protein [Bradyrhizobium brasilense]SDF51030.1 hypothetical protein SAMN05216337_10592 [Bradyrhizobium brasilense]
MSGARVVSLCIVLACCGVARHAIEQAAEPEPPAVNLKRAHGMPQRLPRPDRTGGAARVLRNQGGRTRSVAAAFPELLDRENALRKALAEQVQTRTMSLLERNIPIRKLHSQLLEEERRRLSAAPADAGEHRWRSRNGGNPTRKVAAGSEVTW